MIEEEQKKRAFRNGKGSLKTLFYQSGLSPRLVFIPNKIQQNALYPKSLTPKILLE